MGSPAHGGSGPARGFIGTKTGAAVLSYNNLQTDGRRRSGVDVHGQEHLLNIYQRGDLYEMRDQSQPMFVSNGGEITTHNADQAPSDEVTPTDQNIVTDDDTSFIGSKFTSTGAVDAHWGTGQVYEFHRAPSISDKYVYWYQDKNPDNRDDLRGSIIRAELGSGRSNHSSPSRAAVLRIGVRSPRFLSCRETTASSRIAMSTAI